MALLLVGVKPGDIRRSQGAGREPWGSVRGLCFLAASGRRHAGQCVPGCRGLPRSDAVRGVRAAACRGHGVRGSGDLLERDLRAGGRGGRGFAFRASRRTWLRRRTRSGSCRTASLRARLAEKGSARAALFRWPEAASRIVDSSSGSRESGEGRQGRSRGGSKGSNSSGAGAASGHDSRCWWTCRRRIGSRCSTTLRTCWASASRSSSWPFAPPTASGSPRSSKSGSNTRSWVA